MIKKLTKIANYIEIKYASNMIENGASMKRWQMALSKLGYNTGKVDGYWGPITESATREFQSTNFIPETGFVDEVSISTMKSKPYKSKKTMAPVELMQYTVEESKRNPEAHGFANKVLTLKKERDRYYKALLGKGWDEQKAAQKASEMVDPQGIYGINYGLDRGRQRHDAKPTMQMPVAKPTSQISKDIKSDYSYELAQFQSAMNSNSKA